MVILWNFRYFFSFEVVVMKIFHGDFAILLMAELSWKLAVLTRFYRLYDWLIADLKIFLPLQFSKSKVVFFIDGNIRLNNLATNCIDFYIFAHALAPQILRNSSNTFSAAHKNVDIKKQLKCAVEQFCIPLFRRIGPTLRGSIFYLWCYLSL